VDLIMAALLWFTTRQHLRLRRLWFVLLLLVGPAGLALLVRFFEPPRQLDLLKKLYHAPMLFMLFMAVLPLVCMLHGAALIGSEVDGRTLAYLTTRRMRRETVLLERFAAVWLLITVLVELAAAAFHFCTVTGLDVDRLNAEAGVTADLAWRPWHDLLCYSPVLPVAVAAFLAVFTMISLVFRRPLVISILYLVVAELVVSNTPAKARIYTITHQLRLLSRAFMPNLLDVFTTPRNRTTIESFFPPDAIGVIPLIVVIFLALAIACLAIRMRELQPVKAGRE
jgi:ABC-2 type transport system permease protein